jgi:hypothetical protein
MTNLPPDSYVDQDAEARHHALLSLHALSGAFGDLDPTIFPGFTPASPGTAMQALAAAPEREIPVSARLAVLFNLARAGLPHYESYEGEYRLLADSVAQSRGLDVDQLLIDLKESARGIPFSGTGSGQALPHHETAFIGENVCTVRNVKVGGLRATWVFSEFETDVDGQALELGWQREGRIDLTADDYLELIMKKTCWYTTVLPLRVGSLIGTKGAANLGPLLRFGFFLGRGLPDPGRHSQPHRFPVGVRQGTPG